MLEDVVLAPGVELAVLGVSRLKASIKGSNPQSIPKLAAFGHLLKRSLACLTRTRHNKKRKKCDMGEESLKGASMIRAGVEGIVL